MSLNELQLSPTTKELLTQDAVDNIPFVRLVKLPLMISDADADCMEPEVEENYDGEPPNKKKKIVPYKLKETDKKTVYDSGTVIYTEEFKRSVWDFLCCHSLAEGELRYPEISHSVLYKWRRKALEERGEFVPQRHVESRKSLLADLKKDKREEESKEQTRRYSEPLKVPKLKISLKLAQQNKEEQKCTNGKKVIAALSDDLPVEKKVRVVTFALQNSTQKAAEHYGLRAGEVHSFMSQNAIRRMALDRIRQRVTKGSKGGERSQNEINEIVRLARLTNVERAARQYGVKEGQVLTWMRLGPGPRNAICNGSSNGTPKTADFDIEFQMKVLDLARKQSLSRACKVFQIQPSLVQNWMKKYFPEEEVNKVVTQPESNNTEAPVDADELEKMLFERLQEPSSRIRALDQGEIAMETIVTILKVALMEGSKLASSQFNIPRTTIATWITRNSLEELVRGKNAVNLQASPKKSQPSPPVTPITNGTSVSSRPTRSFVRATRNSNRSPSSSPVPQEANGDELEMLEAVVDDNNNDATVCSKETAPPEQKSIVKNQPNGLTVIDPNYDGVQFRLDQLETARELGITMRCLSRWLEVRQHFMKFRKGLLATVKGDTLKEILTFRLDAVDYAVKEGKVYTASIFRVTLSELHEWSKQRDAYMRALLGGSQESAQALVVLDKASDLLFENSGRSRAQAIADQLGIDLNLTNKFIQQLYAAY